MTAERVSPSPPAPVAAAFAALPGPQSGFLPGVRDLVFAAVSDGALISELIETPKWGGPADLTEAGRSGSTLRLGLVRGEEPAMFVMEIGDGCGHRFRYGDDTGVVLPEEVQADAARHAARLTDHLRRRSR